LEQCEERLEELFQELMADLAQKESTRAMTKTFVKLKFNDFTRLLPNGRGSRPPCKISVSSAEAFARTGKPVRLTQGRRSLRGDDAGKRKIDLL
jgi:hypothetical protein